MKEGRCFELSTTTQTVLSGSGAASCAGSFMRKMRSMTRKPMIQVPKVQDTTMTRIAAWSLSILDCSNGKGVDGMWFRVDRNGREVRESSK